MQYSKGNYILKCHDGVVVNLNVTVSNWAAFQYTVINLLLADPKTSYNTASRNSIKIAICGSVKHNNDKQDL